MPMARMRAYRPTVLNIAAVTSVQAKLYIRPRLSVSVKEIVKKKRDDATAIRIATLARAKDVRWRSS